MEKLETEWETYPVLHFSMAGVKHADEEMLESYLDERLKSLEDLYGIKEPAVYPNDRLA